MINKDVIQLVQKHFTRAGKISADKIKNFIIKNEPEFNKYLETSTYEDLRLLVERLGIPPTKELMEGLSSTIIGGKIEGYLIHSIAQDKFWSHKYGIDSVGGLKPEDKFKLFLDGKLDPVHYDYQLTKEEANNPKNYKRVALENFKNNQQKMKIENEILSKKSQDKKEPEKESSSKKTAISGDLLD